MSKFWFSHGLLISSKSLPEKSICKIQSLFCRSTSSFQKTGFAVQYTVYLYTGITVPRVPECLSHRRNWVPPLPPEQASVSPPWTHCGGEQHSLAGEGGVGGPHSNDWIEKPVYSVDVQNSVMNHQHVHRTILCHGKSTS